MAFDWEYFAKEGMSPAVKMYQDYITGGINSQVKNQEYQQKMQKAQYDAQIESKQAKEDYEYKVLLEDTEQTHKRQIILDKYTSAEMLELLRNKNKLGQLEYGRGTDIVAGKIKQKAAEYSNFSQKDVALYKYTLKEYGITNPEGLIHIKQANFIKNKQHYMTSNDVKMKAEQENTDIWNNYDYKRLRGKQALGKEPLTDGEQKALNLFEDRYKTNLDKIDKTTLIQNGIREAIFRQEAGYQFGDRIPHSPEDARWIQSIGCPVPYQEPNPDCLSMDNHIEFIRRSRRDNRMMPNDTAGLKEMGFDVAWLTGNWEIYAQYFAKHPNYTVKELFELMGRKK